MGELTTNDKTEIATIATTQGLAPLIKPLVKEILLFDSFVAGTTHLKEPAVLDEIKVGDKLVLRREENKYDDKAIMILTSDGKKLGYVPEKDNVVFSRLMDAGKMLAAKITEIQPRGKSFKLIKIAIFLVDF